AAATTVREVRLVRDGTATTAIIELDGEAVFKYFNLTNPLRLAVDIKNVHQSIRLLTHADEHIIINVNESGIERIRIGQMGNNVRVVFDLAMRQRYQMGMIGA